MGERTHQSAQEPLVVEKRFRTEFFGFDRVEVLTYIERISAANAEKARALQDTITALQQDLHDAQDRNSSLERRADEVFSELQTEKKRAEEAVAEADALRKEVRRANDEIAAVRSRLFARDQENATLKNDNARLTQTVDSLTQELTGGVVRMTGKLAKPPAPPVPQEDEKAQAQRTRLKALRAQLAAVDAKILEATSELQRATDGITAALEGELAPAPAAAQSEPTPAQASVYEREWSMRPSGTPQGAAQPGYGAQTPALPTDGSGGEETPQGYGGREGAAAQEWAAAHARSAGSGGPYRSQYRATNGRPLPAPGVTPQGARPSQVTDQYDAVQLAARTTPPEETELPQETPAPAVDLPKVPPRRQPESDTQIPFGKPHAPRAMPFTPFDPYSPHTAPYIEPGAEAARILKTPPPPPPQLASAAKPYVPQPTPIRSGASLSEPLIQPAETALAAMPQTQPKRAAAQEPVIIPYSMPIPPQGQRAAPKPGTPLVPFADGWERVGPQQSLKEQERRGSALSEDLLAHLNRLINGEEEP